ncbi:MAG: hypothetical protein ACPGOY_02670 [Rhodospirillaceae bacterium]
MMGVSEAQAQAGPPGAALSPELLAAINSGDVEAAGAALASVISQGGNIEAVGRAIAQTNADVAAAVVNSGLRQASATVGTAQLSGAIRSLVSGTVSGLPQSVTPQEITTFAENVATNVRQAISAISGGNQNLSNQLLASARSGVAVSQVGGPGTTGATRQVAAILRGQIQQRLGGNITQQEAQSAPEESPVVVTRQGAQPETPVTPVTEPVAENDEPAPDPVVAVNTGTTVFVDTNQSEDDASQN